MSKIAINVRQVIVVTFFSISHTLLDMDGDVFHCYELTLRATRG